MPSKEPANLSVWYVSKSILSINSNLIQSQIVLRQLSFQIAVMPSKSKKSDKNLMAEILMSKRKVQIRGLYSSEELERKKTDLKKNGSSKSLIVKLPLNSSKSSDTEKSKELEKSKTDLKKKGSSKSLKVKLPLKSPTRISDSLQVKKSNGVSPVKQVDKSFSKKSVVLKSPHTGLAKEEDRLDKGINTVPGSGEKARLAFKNAFLLEIEKVEVNMQSKFERVNKHLAEEMEKSINLQKANTDLQKENDKINQSMENLKKLIVPMKMKLEEHKSQKDNIRNVEKGLREEIEKLKALNGSLTEKVASLHRETSTEDVSVLRKELDAQKKKVEEMDEEKKNITQELNSKERSLKLANSQCFTLKEELYKLKKEQSSNQENRVTQMNKFKLELSEVKKNSELYKKTINDKFRIDKEESEKIILEKEQEIKELKEALEEVKRSHISSSKRKQCEENNLNSKRKRIDKSSETLESDPSLESEIRCTKPAQNSLLAFIDNFAASLSSTTNSMLITDDLNGKDGKEGKEANLDKCTKIDDKNPSAEKESQETESSLDMPCYSPAKTSNVAKSSMQTKKIIKIRDFKSLLQSTEDGQETLSPVKRIDFESKEDQEDSNSAFRDKKYLDRDVKAAVEKCLQRFQQTKAIASGEEYRELVNRFVRDFKEKIRSTYLQTNPTEKGISITNPDKQNIIDQIILYFNLKDSVNNYTKPFELKILLQLKLNQKSFADLKKDFVNELFTSLREVSQGAVIAKFARSDPYYSIGHDIVHHEKIRDHWLIKRFVDHALGLMGFNVTTPVVSL